MFAQWEWQNPKPQGNDILDSYFLDENLGWAVGNYGAFIKSTDGGTSWERLNLGLNTHCISVVFINAAKGFIGDRNGNLLQTFDGGRNWTIQHLDDYAYVHVFFRDEYNGWILSDADPTDIRKVYRTTNGGESWEANFITSLGRFYDIYFINVNKGFVVGNNGEVQMTNDGGVTWDIINTPTIDRLYKITFNSNSQGHIVGNDGTYLNSSDGGHNWSLNSLGSHTLWDISFSNESNDGIIVGNYGTIFYTTNAGLSWINKSISTVDAFHSANSIGESSNLIFGEHGIMYITTNQGSSWNNMTNGERISINDLQFINNYTGFAVGNNGLLETYDAGENWTKKDLDIEEWLNSLFFINEIKGWIIGNSGLLLQTTNGGINWLIDTIPNVNWKLNSIFFANENKGFAAGYSGQLYTSFDGGSNWVSEIIGSGTDLEAIFFIDESIGYIVGGKHDAYIVYGEIHRTTNGGDSWELIRSANEHYNAVFFINPQVGWVVGYYNIVLKTIDGGMTWQKITIPGLIEGADIYFADSLHGTIVTSLNSGGGIIFTNDGGNTWHFQNQINDNALHCTFMKDTNRIWVGGQLGTIIFSGKGGTITDMTRDEIYTNIPQEIYLSQNYPNPFNPVTKIKFTIPTSPLNPSPYQGEGQRERFITLKVYDVLGRKIITLVNEEKPAGEYEIEFNGYNLTSGIYFYRIQVGDYINTKKMVLLK